LAIFLEEALPPFPFLNAWVFIEKLISSNESATRAANNQQQVIFNFFELARETRLEGIP
jgi:hypothetical protein